VPSGAATPAIATRVSVRESPLSDFERKALARLAGETTPAASRQGLDAGAPLPRLIELRRRLMLADRLS
jgi:hypothetical protein